MAREGLPFRLRDFHPLRSPFPVTLLAVRLEKAFVTPRGLRSGPHHRPTTPHGQRLRALTPVRFGLFPVRSPLLGESRLISPPPATGMFPFAGFASAAYVFGDGCRTSTARRVTPFGNPRIIACSAAPRGLSQLATPFIASGCRGIHRPPLPYLRSRRPIHFSKTGNDSRVPRVVYDSPARGSSPERSRSHSLPIPRPPDKQPVW